LHEHYLNKLQLEEQISPNIEEEIRAEINEIEYKKSNKKKKHSETKSFMFRKRLSSQKER
jgi:hypothetical protein